MPTDIRFKPMLATEADVAQLKFPLFASPKLDGIRASVVGGRLLTRTLKEVPNRYVYGFLSQPIYDGWDGELIIGPPNAKDVYRNTVSGVMSREGVPDFTWYVFDHWGEPTHPWTQRHTRVDRGGRIIKLDQHEVRRLDELEELEARVLEEGYEGLILRDPNAPYKFGRSTAKEGYLLKLKRFQDSEAEVLDVIEEMFNGNEAMADNLGRTKRSSAKAGKTGKGRMGALRVRDLKTGVEFELGTGFSSEDKDWWWYEWHETDSKPKHIVKYKFFPVGVKDKPRHPVYLGLRDRRDL